MNISSSEPLTKQEREWQAADLADRKRLRGLEDALRELMEYAASVWFDEATATDEERELLQRARAALKDKP